jgi:hypothetical protein
MESLKEGADIEWLAPDRRDAEVARLTDPWIGDEGALDAELRRGLRPLRPRGVAFDERTTVVWDEAGVQVVRAKAPDPDEPDVTALRSRVLLRAEFQKEGPKSLYRIDYLQRGALRGSRFTTEGGEHGA